MEETTVLEENMSKDMTAKAESSVSTQINTKSCNEADKTLDQHADETIENTSMDPENPYTEDPQNDESVSIGTDIRQEEEKLACKSSPNDEAVSMVTGNNSEGVEVKQENDKSVSRGTGAGTQESGTSVDPYAYIKREEFTSEIYKIEIQNLPKRFGIGQLKKRLISQKLNPVKLKTPNNGNYAFVTFKCEEDREAALKTLEGHVWKGRTFKVKKALPAADPLLKRKLQAASDDQSPEKKAKLSEEADNLSIEERLKNAVTPLWKIPYEEQLKTKENTICEFMKKLTREAEKNNYGLKPWLSKQKNSFNGCCCEILPIKHSPVLDGYRNKCEFTIGKSLEGKDKVVGFRLGSYKEGTGVAEPTNIDSLLNPPMKKVVQDVQDYLAESKWSSFNAIDHSGHWSQLMVRTTRSGEVMAIITFNSHDLSQEDIDESKQLIKTYFTEGPGKDSHVTSFFFIQRTEGQKDFQYEHLFGDKYIQEDLLSLKFRISPDAFFQVNTLAAEVLYSTIADWCKVTPNTSVLDICCGTGTIGITMAKKAKRVIGIEMVKQATDDARENARINGVDNTEYYCGKAEDELPLLMYKCSGDDVVAVVDPPRSGLNYKVIQAIRKAEYVKRLVYVSCNPSGALLNMVDLMRAPSNRIRGTPFRPIKAQPVDLFPHTKHCELVILFERSTDEQN